LYDQSTHGLRGIPCGIRTAAWFVREEKDQKGFFVFGCSGAGHVNSLPEHADHVLVRFFAFGLPRGSSCFLCIPAHTVYRWMHSMFGLPIRSYVVLFELLCRAVLTGKRRSSLVAFCLPLPPSYLGVGHVPGGSRHWFFLALFPLLEDMSLSALYPFPHPVNQFSAPLPHHLSVPTPFFRR